MIITSKTTIVNSTWQNAYVSDGYYHYHAALISTAKRGDPDWFNSEARPVPDMTPNTIFMGAEAVELEIPFTDISNKVKSGFYVGPKDTLMLGVEVVNYNKEDRDVYTVSEVEYVNGRPEGFAQGDTRQIPMGICDGDQKSWMDSMNIHAPKDLKNLNLGGKKERETQRDG